MNEDDIIREIQKRVPASLAAGIIGIGDDAAVVDGPNGISTLVTKDLLTEGVHFLSDRIPPRSLGFKSLAVNVSDIAAMGGTPRHAFLALALPPKFAETDWIADFLDGFGECAELTNVSLLGGDTTRSLEHIFISVTVFGDIPSLNVKRRSTARPGDLIGVTAPLGDSYAGLREVLGNVPPSDHSSALIQRHYQPRLNVAEGVFLGSREEVSAMMDLSDGLVTDVSRLTLASQCGANVDISRLPVSPELESWSVRHNLNSREVAAAGGEDYALLFTFRAQSEHDLRLHYNGQFETPFSIIGEITAEGGPRFFDGKKPVRISLDSYSHFCGKCC